MSKSMLGSAATTMRKGYFIEYKAKKASHYVMLNLNILTLAFSCSMVISLTPPTINERGKKMGDQARAKWEIERYKRVDIPTNDLKILMQIKNNTKNLDAGHHIGPLKFGKASLIELLLIIGDFANILLIYWDVYLPARKVSKGNNMTAFKGKMKLCIMALGCIGSIPVIGDFAVPVIRWNMRNAATLKKMLLKRAGYFEAMMEQCKQ